MIIDPAQTYYISPLLEFQEAKELHAQQAELATLAFLNRNPRDFDQPQLLAQVFLKGALTKARDSRIREACGVSRQAAPPKARDCQDRDPRHPRGGRSWSP